MASRTSLFATVSSSLRLQRWLPVLGVAALATACASAPPPSVKKEVSDGPPVEVMTAEGMVAGYTDGDIHTFRAIPYAAPVGGADRWLPPKPPAKRTGTFNARDVGPACQQTVAEIPRWMLTEAGEAVMYGMTDIQGFAAQEKSGDCLRLNIWTPKLGRDFEAEAKAAADAAAQAKAEADAKAAAEAEALAKAEAAAAASTSTTPEREAAAPATDASETAPAAAVAEAAPAALNTAPTEDKAEAAAPAATEEAAAAPAAPKGLPVIVHMHGGGLTSGSANHPAQVGKRLAAQGVVVVTINYRLGSIGFLAGDGMFDGDHMVGNRGFMDGIRALEWVRDNIAAFGGDPNNVTLAGQSGGGTAVWNILASPRSKGLVHRAIPMSGPIYTFSLDDHKKLTKTVLDGWGVGELSDSGNDPEALADISTEDAQSTASTMTLVGSDEYGEMSRMYLPSAGAHGTEFLPDDILTAVKKGRFNDIDLLIGSCDDDAKVSILMVPLPNSMAIDIWNGYMKGLISPTDEGFDAMTQKYVEAMPEVSETRAKEQLQTDALYRVRALKAADLHAANTTDEAQGKTYVYQFNWKSPKYPEDIGAMHGTDLIFSWGNVESFPVPFGFKDGVPDAKTKKLSDGMLEAWANFAKTGTPSSSNLPEWPEYEPQKRNTMVFDVDTKVVSDPKGHLRKLWDAPAK